jgi:predicted homoserine dehydrogenase-like protein
VSSSKKREYKLNVHISQYGKLLPAKSSLALGGLPIGLANFTLKRPVKHSQCLTWDDVEYDESHIAVKVRKEMEAMFSREWGIAAKN